jgi:hypothetical protein
MKADNSDKAIETELASPPAFWCNEFLAESIGLTDSTFNSAIRVPPLSIFFLSVLALHLEFDVTFSMISVG